jgi:phospholipase A1/A2
MYFRFHIKNIFYKIAGAALIVLLSNVALADTTTTPTDATVTTPAPVLKHSKHRVHSKPRKPQGDTVSENMPEPLPATPNTSVVDTRLNKEAKIPPRFAIGFHRPNYVIPYYYTFSPYNSVYAGNTPNDESLKHDEIKYQLSFELPLWRNIFNYPTSLYFAYTQMSYWQAYNKYAFFRSTDYEPEFYLQTDLDKHMFGSWTFNIVNIGLVHQSNGFGNSLERAWNRAYLLFAVSNPNWMVAFKPWIIFHDSLFEQQNPNMATYMGYEQIIVAYKYKQSVLSFETRNFLESGGRRSGNTLSLSFPLTKYLNGYVQVFSGYGQSLIEYNHRTNSVGVGFSLSNWV